MSEQIKRLGEAEMEIMLVIWASPEPVTSNYVLLQLQGKRKWALSTVMTSLARLVDKGFITCDRSTGSNLYAPLVKEEDYKLKESTSFLEKLHGNSLQGLVTTLYNKKAITDSDLSELKKFIDDIRTDD